MDDENRIRYIDMTRGIAILLMVFTHTMVGDNIVKTWTFAWHMPVFFIISGMLYVQRPNEKILSKWIKNVIRLMIPYFIWGGTYRMACRNRIYLWRLFSGHRAVVVADYVSRSR